MPNVSEIWRRRRESNARPFRVPGFKPGRQATCHRLHEQGTVHGTPPRGTTVAFPRRAPRTHEYLEEGARVERARPVSGPDRFRAGRTFPCAKPSVCAGSPGSRRIRILRRGRRQQRADARLVPTAGFAPASSAYETDILLFGRRWRRFGAPRRTCTGTADLQGRRHSVR